jgi:membrane protein
MKKKLNTIWGIIKETFLKFLDDDPLTHSASIAFYTLFSMPAILLIIVVIAGQVYGEMAVTGELAYQIEHFVGYESAVQIQSIIENVSETEVANLAAVLGIATLLFSATTVFISIQNSLNAIWAVKAKPKSGILKHVLNRVISFAMVIFMGIILIATLVIETILNVFSGYIQQLVTGVAVHFMRFAHYSLSLAIITLLFAFIFKFLPDAKIKWSDVWMGSFVTAILFILGRFGISAYLTFTDFTTSYGAAGSLVIILIWVYYSSSILLLGAEFTQIYSKVLGHTIYPANNAVKVVMQEVPNEELNK